MKKIYEKLLNTTPEELDKLRRHLVGWILVAGKTTGRPDMVEFAEKMRDSTRTRDIVEMCLHLGFSEKAFLESLSGIVNLKLFKVTEEK